MTLTSTRRAAAAALAAASLATVGGAHAASAQPVPMHLSTPAPYSTTVGAHARYSKARVNMGAPNFALLTALVAAGGGAEAFDAQKLLGDLAGSSPPTQSASANLTRRVGAAQMSVFAKTFAFFIRDARAQATTAGMTLPATPVPDPRDGRALAAALYAAGVSPRGAFDVEYMLDTLVTHVIHVEVMNDIDADPELGPSADRTFHEILAQAVRDLK
jgi:hypothetical protein